MTAFDFTPLLSDNLPPAAAPWAGYPEHNFVGGHNDREAIPVDALIAAVTKQLREKGADLATYHLHGGPQGMLELREFVARKMIRDRGMPTTPDQVMITSGSLQGLDLVNSVLLSPGDTVIIEENTYGGMLSRSRGREPGSSAHRWMTTAFASMRSRRSWTVSLPMG